MCNVYLDPIPIASASAMQVLCFHKSPVDHHISSWFTSAFFVARLENALGFYGLALSCLSRDEPGWAVRCRKMPEVAWCGLTLVTHLLYTSCFHLHQPGPNMYSQTHFPSSLSYVPCPGGSIRGGTCLDTAKLRLNMLEQNGAESPLNHFTAFSSWVLG